MLGGITLTVLPLLASRVNEKHLFIVILVAVMVFLLTSGRRPNRRCKRCREVNREQAEFCAQCGKKLLEKK